MDIKNLITFMEVAERSSFTGAARKLGYSQSTVSFQIRQLEKELDTQLFERINHTVVLTEKGRDVLKYAHAVSKLTQELRGSMQDGKTVKGHIRLAMADSLCDSFLSEQFPDFRQRYPGITLEIIAAGTEEMFRLLNQNEADAILTLDNHLYHTEYRIVREEKAQMHFIAAADNPLCREKRIPVHRLPDEPFLLTEKGMSYRRLMDEKLAGMSLEIQPVLEVGSTSRICFLVERGVGMSFLPDYVTAGQVAGGRMVYLDVDDLAIDVWKQLLHHRDKWVSPQMESVMRYCISREFLKDG